MKIPLFAARSIVAMSLLSLGSAPTEAASNGSQNSVFPQQVEARVPFAPTAFESEGASHLVYELYLTNFTPVPVEIRRIEVLDADMAADQPLAVFEGATLADVLDAVGGQSKTPAQLAPGASVVAYLWLSIKDGAPVPNHLRHRVLTADNSAEGTVIATHNSDLLRLSAPVRGANWLASDGPSNDRDNHHRRGILVINQRAVDSRRYAVDWMLTKNGQTAGTGERSDRNNYYAYAQSVYAVADAVVASAKDGQPENVPALPANFHPAVPITMNTIGGNNIVLSLGHGQYAYYFHLKTGSVQVKAGDHVRRGEAIAQIGVSGDATVPHLHFEVTTSPLIVAGDGVPYEIDHYRVKGADNEWHDRTNGLPLNKMTVDFGPDTPAKK
jgi:hypothetical protein